MKSKRLAGSFGTICMVLMLGMTSLIVGHAALAAGAGSAEAALQTGDEALKSYSKAATCFCKTQAYALQVKRMAEKP